MSTNLNCETTLAPPPVELLNRTMFMACCRRARRLMAAPPQPSPQPEPPASTQGPPLGSSTNPVIIDVWTGLDPLRSVNLEELWNHTLNQVGSLKHASPLEQSTFWHQSLCCSFCFCMCLVNSVAIDHLLLT